MEKDISQKLNNRSTVAAAVTANGAVNGAAVDTQAIQTGLMFALGAIAYTDGAHVISFEQADDSGFTQNVNVIGADQLVGAIADISAVTTNGDALAKIGILYTQQFVRAVITSTGVTTGATILAIATEHVDDAPSPATTESL
jgi:hypothetical protein